MSQDRIFRVKFYIIMIVCVCSSEKVTRRESGDEIIGSVICSICTCDGAHKTYYNEPGNEKCINAKQTGCQFQVQKYTSDIPTVTQSMLKNEVFQVTKVGSDLCPVGFTPSIVRISALTGSWEEVPAFMSSSISVIVLSAELKITFRKIWPGLLIRIEVRCEEPGRGEYALIGNCVLFKYAGSIEYPVTLSSFEEKSTTSTTLKTTKTTTTISQSTSTTTSKSTLKTSAKSSLSSTSEATPSPTTSTVTKKLTTAKISTTITPVTTESTIRWTLSSQSSSFKNTTATASNTSPNPSSEDSSNDNIIIGSVVGFIILLLFIATILAIKFRKCSSLTKAAKTKANKKLALSCVLKNEKTVNIGQDKTIENGEYKTPSKQVIHFSTEEAAENRNYAPLIFSSQESKEPNYAALWIDHYEIPVGTNGQQL